MITQNGSIPKKEVVKTISRIRREWQAAHDGNNLAEVYGNVGYFLADLATGFNLSPKEQRQVLGSSLYKELEDVLTPACPVAK